MNETVKPNYIYAATIDRVVDGDTVIATVDIGFRLNAKMPVRLAHINARERNQVGGKSDTEHLIKLIGDGKVVMRTVKPIDKYGRWLAEIYKDDVYINEQMITDGHAVAYEGEAR